MSLVMCWTLGWLSSEFCCPAHVLPIIICRFKYSNPNPRITEKGRPFTLLETGSQILQEKRTKVKESDEEK